MIVGRGVGLACLRAISGRTIIVSGSNHERITPENQAMARERKRAQIPYVDE